MSVRNTAIRLSSLGYHVIPLVERSKAARDKDWTSLRYTPQRVQTIFSENTPLNLGLLTGTEVATGVFLIAVDIDLEDAELIANVRHAFEFPPPAKKGRKGMTFFARATEAMKKRIFNRKDEDTGKKQLAVEILATGQQTAIPPSIHPDGMAYEWIGPHLTDFDPNDLPLIDEQVLSEIDLAVRSPHSNLFLLNCMEASTPDSAGNVHNSVVSAVATMIGHKWTDEQIWARVERATRLADSRSPRPADRRGWQQEVLDMCRSGREKGFDVQSKKHKIEKIVAQWFIGEYVGEGKVYNRDGRLMLYKDGCFNAEMPDTLRHLIATCYPEPNGVSLASDGWRACVNTIIDISPRFPTGEPSKKVCLANGTIDLDTGELGDWRTDDFLISRLPFDHDPDAKCPHYEKFMAQTFDGDKDADKAIATYEEFLAHTLFECLEFEKFLVLKGEPGTGKSTLTKLARLMHGKDAVSAVPVHSFVEERYRATMVGKLINIVSEVQATSHAADDFLKAVTSGDEVQVRYLYAEPFLVKLPTRLLIACNDMFRIRDTSGAVERRMIILPFNNVVPKEKKDRKLIGRLQKELPGIFNRLVRAWHNLQERGFFDPPQSSDVQVSRFALENNHVHQWVLERTHEGLKSIDKTYVMPKKRDGTECSALYMDYVEWSKLNGFKQFSSIAFGMKLSQLRIDGVASLDVEIIWVGGRAVRIRPLNLLNEGRY